MSSTNKLSFLDEDVTDEAEAEVTTTEDVSPEAPEPTVARDEKGRFAASEPKGEETDQPVPPVVETSAPPAPEPEKPTSIPITALLDEREKRQKAEAEAARMAALLQQYQRQQQQPAPQPVPDPIEDAQGYTAHLMRSVQQATLNDRLNMSEELAREKFGNEEVEAAKAWALSNPHVAQAALGQPHPYKTVVEEFRRMRTFQEIGPDPEAFKARIREETAAEMRERIKAEVLAELQAQAQAKVTPRTPPPPSMAATSGVGTKEPPLDDVQVFKSVFAR